ncbi:MAG TPA: ATP-binding protein, partial [Bacteroidota bacterium]
GAIDVLFSMPREISTSERQMFTIIGSLVGAALESARLYEQTLEKSKEIERQNRELSDFTYVVSHDLKEPLVGLEGFSVMLLNQYGAQLDEEAKDYLQTLAKLSAHMKTLINDLLNYARVGEESLAKEVVDVNDVIHHLQQELDLYVRQKKARIKVVSPLPKVMYPDMALTEVFRNLISNAIKFSDKPQPTVEIGCESNQTEHRFFVRDNGIGIHKEYFEKIFHIFQRLNYNERYEGTGIGLTIARKIVESYGGAIWVESAEGKGSTFFFTVIRQTAPSP